MSRTFEDKPAVRESVPLLVGVCGPSGGGKTYSALRLATGIQRVSGGDIYFIDSESKRACHYADKFNFRHIDFQAPFGSIDYLEAVQHCVKKGAGVIVIDSLSHEHEGPGGYLMTHAEEIERMSGGDYQKAERVKFAGWIKPAKLRRQFINGILQLNTNIVCCFRAKEKLKLERGKDPQALGWMPIAGEEFTYEMTAMALLYPGSNGVPTWNPELPGEKIMRKLPEQFVGILNDGKALCEDHGEKLASWARGIPPKPLLDDLPEAWSTWTNEERGANRASKGLAALSAWWKTVSSADQKTLKPTLDSTWKPDAVAADKKP